MNRLGYAAKHTVAPADAEPAVLEPQIPILELAELGLEAGDRRLGRLDQGAGSGGLGRLAGRGLPLRALGLWLRVFVIQRGRS